MHWYYKAGIAIGLLWGTLRALGVYGEDLRDVDLRFVYGFLATTGSFAGVFLIIDRVAKALGWRRERPDVPPDAIAGAATPSATAAARTAAATTRPPAGAPAVATPEPSATGSAPGGRPRTSRRARRR